MKKVIPIIPALMLILSMAFPVAAVTPPLQVPDLPEIPDISDDIHFELPGSAFEGYLPEIDIEVAEHTELTEPPKQEKVGTVWHDVVNGLYQRWKDILAKVKK